MDSVGISSRWTTDFNHVKTHQERQFQTI